MFCLSDEISIKNVLKHDYTLSPLFFRCTLEYTFMRAEAKANGFRLSGTYQLFVCADDVNLPSGSVRAIKRNIKTLVAAIKKIIIVVESVYCAVRTYSLYKADYVSSLKG